MSVAGAASFDTGGTAPRTPSCYARRFAGFGSGKLRKLTASPNACLHKNLGKVGYHARHLAHGMSVRQLCTNDPMGKVLTI